MDASRRDWVWERAGNCCEYCRIAQAADIFFIFHVEHIVARQHGGADDPDNLALACPFCNRYKGTNLTGIDRESGELARLYHPRQDLWDDHFQLQDGIVLGLTAIGRTTVTLLRMNDPLRVALRRVIPSGS